MKLEPIPSTARFFSVEESEALPQTYKKALEVAYHRAQTRQSLHKYDAVYRDLRFGKQLGFGLIEKQNGFNDVAQVKRLDEYQRDRQQAVEKALLLAARRFYLSQIHCYN
jgi:hypothetical protein